MNRIATFFALILVVILAFSCGGKKDESQEVSATDSSGDEMVLNSCPVGRIEVEPTRAGGDDCHLRSDCKVDLTATAYDHNGNPIDVPLTWSFRYHDWQDERSAGQGHSLQVLGNRKARFTASGLATGTYTVLVQDRTCNLIPYEEVEKKIEKKKKDNLWTKWKAFWEKLATKEEAVVDEGPPEQYVEGQAWIKVTDNPEDQVVCGRMRVTYGARLDRVGDEVVAAAKILLLAEVFAEHNLGYKYRVIFYLNDKAFPSRRPLFNDVQVVRPEGAGEGYIALLPLYITPGRYEVRYELKKGDQTICGSRNESFSAR